MFRVSDKIATTAFGERKHADIVIKMMAVLGLVHFRTTREYERVHHHCS